MAVIDKCPVCGSKIGKSADACGICGTAFDAIPPKCPLCDTEIDESVAECSNCGAEIENNHESIPDTAVDEVETAEMPSEADKETAELIGADVFVDIELEELVKLSGVGPLKAKILYDAGYADLRILKRASVVELMNIRGIGRKAAGEIKASLRESSLEKIRETEITKETVEAEHQCPLCETIVSAYEASCYECGCIFEPSGVSDEDSDRLALSYYDSKLLRSPENKDLWYARGATLAKIEEYDQALNSFNRALEFDKSFQAAWMSKAEVYNKLGDSTKAAECYSHIITSASAGMAFGSVDDDDEFIDELRLDKPVDEGIVPTGSEEPKEEPELAEEPVTEEELPDAIVPTDSLEDDYLVEEPVTEEELPDATVPTDSLEDDYLVEEPVTEQEPEIVEDDSEPELAEEPDAITVSPSQELSESVMAPTEGPKIIKPHSFDDLSSSGINIKMDYTRPEPERPDLDSMTETQIKKYLSKRASYVKPYLGLARDLNIDINHAKRLIAKAVVESKKGNMKLAIEIIDEGIDFAEAEFHKKVADNLESLASLIRNLKMTGTDVSGAVELITETKKMLVDGKITEAVESLQQCLNHVEKISA